MPTAAYKAPQDHTNTQTGKLTNKQTNTARLAWAVRETQGSTGFWGKPRAARVFKFGAVLFLLRTVEHSSWFVHSRPRPHTGAYIKRAGYSGSLFVCLFVCLLTVLQWSVVDIALPRMEPTLPEGRQAQSFSCAGSDLALKQNTRTGPVVPPWALPPEPQGRREPFRRLSTARPSTLQPHTAQSSTARPSTSQPCTTQSSTAQPSMARPSMAQARTA